MGALFDYLDGAERIAAETGERALCARYGLDDLRAGSSRRDYREVVDLLSVLDDVRVSMPWAPDRPLRVVDVGARNWSYVGALERFFRRRAAKIELSGVEVDGHGIYPNGHARCDYAEAYAAQTGNPAVRYEVADFCEWGRGDEGAFDCVTMFFPFLTRYALLDWGLPSSLFAPAAVIGRAVELLRPGGVLVSLHQTAVEQDRMVAHLERFPEVSVKVERACPTRLVAHWPKLADRRMLAVVKAT